MRNKSFTLLELLIVISVIGILSTVLLVVLKPNELIAKARDTQRISDLTNYEKNIRLALLEPDTNLSVDNVIYLSLPDTSTGCSSWTSQLPSLPSGWSYKCSNEPEKADGTGWLPINFNNTTILNINNIKLDPLNTPPYYYSFVEGSFELTAYLEYSGNRATTNSPSSKDGGTNLKLFETGDDKTVTPISFEEQRVGDGSSLISGVFTIRNGVYGVTATNPAPVYDGNTITSVPLGSTNDYYIENDLGSVKNVKKIRIFTDFNSAFYGEEIIVVSYFNGSTWVSIGEAYSSGWNEWTININTSKVRLYHFE
ncbi:MAG: type II secretion system protein, partial [Patescibacteria group bacterium]